MTEPLNTTCWGGVTTRWEEVTPADAARYLLRNNHNRRFMPTLKERYRIDHEAGDWLQTHEGLAFDEDGELLDGQHRLQTIVDSGKSMILLVTRGLPRRVIEVINRGKMRTLAHTLQILGYQIHDARTVSVARRMRLGITPAEQPTPSDTVIRRFIDQHVDALLFATGQIPGKLAPAPVAAVVARAYYHAEVRQLERFAAAMQDRIPIRELRPGDQSARALGAFISAVRAQKATGSEAAAIIYRKAQNALHHFLRGNDLTTLQEKSRDLFPLPGTPEETEDPARPRPASSVGA